MCSTAVALVFDLGQMPLWIHVAAALQQASRPTLPEGRCSVQVKLFLPPAQAVDTESVTPVLPDGKDKGESPNPAKSPPDISSELESKNAELFQQTGRGRKSMVL